VACVLWRPARLPGHYRVWLRRSARLQEPARIVNGKRWAQTLPETRCTVARFIGPVDARKTAGRLTPVRRAFAPRGARLARSGGSLARARIRGSGVARDSHREEKIFRVWEKNCPNPLHPGPDSCEDSRVPTFPPANGRPGCDSRHPL